jgi:formate dehydrogenase maturation protein FdhE
MSDERSVVEAAERLHREKDEAALEVLLGLRAEAIKQNPALQGDPDFEPPYDSQTQGGLDEIKAVGRRIVKRWNKELYGLVCGAKSDDQKERKAVLDSLQLGEAAVVAAVAGALLSLGLAAALAAAAAPLIVKRFIWPAKEELCAAWGEKIAAQV